LNVDVLSLSKQEQADICFDNGQLAADEVGFSVQVVGIVAHEDRDEERLHRGRERKGVQPLRQNPAVGNEVGVAAFQGAYGLGEAVNDLIGDA